MKNQLTTIKSCALSRFLQSTGIAGLLPALVLLLSIQSSHAGSATWKSAPHTGDWNTAGNWTPATVPNGPSDTATFASSNITGVSDSLNTEVNGIVFNAGASAFTVTIAATSTFGPTFTISGVGITNNSGIMQNVVNNGVVNGNTAFMIFTNSASAGSLTTFTNIDNGRIDFFSTSTADNGIFINSGAESNETLFHDTSTAGNGSFTNNGADTGGGSSTQFTDSATAGNGTFTTNGGSASFGVMYFSGTATAANGTFTTNGGAEPATMFFLTTSTAGSGIFTTNGGAASGEAGGTVEFTDTSTADNGIFTTNGGTVSGASGGFTIVGGLATGTATFTTNGGAVSGAGGGVTSFTAAASLGSGTIIANAGLGGGAGGLIQVMGDATGGTARVEVFGNGTGDSTNGTLDVSVHNAPAATIGSIEGSGLVILGSNNLTVGANNLTTAFSGIISDGTGSSGGSLTKAGRGKLTLSKASTYTGGTTVSKGTLLVTNRTGSATGTGTVAVNAGTLGGTGKISGAVTIGTATTAAILAPGSGARPGKLTLSKTLTFNALANYKVDLNSTLVTADQVAAKGVTINSSATVTIDDLGTAVLTSGTVFTIISNTATTAIVGTFSNLADGSTLTVGSNTYLVSYEGGTGNDLTLTVQ